MSTKSIIVYIFGMFVSQATSENASEIGNMRTDEAVKTTVQQIISARFVTVH